MQGPLVSLSQEETQKLTLLLKHPKIVDLLDSDDFVGQKRFNFASIFAQRHNPEEEDFGKVLSSFANHKLATRSPLLFPDFNTDEIYEFSKSLPSPWPQKLQKVVYSPGIRRESELIERLFIRHYQDLRTVHKILLAILKKIEVDQDAWILIEKLLFHLAAAAKEIDRMRKEVATNNPALTQAMNEAKDKSVEELHKQVLVLKMAALNSNSYRSKKKGTPDKTQSFWVPKKDSKASRVVEGDAKRN
jgi:hypothetical protein